MLLRTSPVVSCPAERKHGSRRATAARRRRSSVNKTLWKTTARHSSTTSRRSRPRRTAATEQATPASRPLFFPRGRRVLSPFGNTPEMFSGIRCESTGIRPGSPRGRGFSPSASASAVGSPSAESSNLSWVESFRATPTAVGGVEKSPRIQRNRQHRGGFYNQSLDSPDLETF